MTERERRILVSRSKKRKVEVEFGGGDITTDGGVSLLNLADKRLNLTKRLAGFITDPRDPKKTTYPLLQLIRQRIYAIGLGYEDVNDHDFLRYDAGFQTAVNTDKTTAGKSTVNRVEKVVVDEDMWKITDLLVNIFIESFDSPPSEIILDFDGTDDRVHGNQVGGYYHGYYKHECFLPLYVFSGDHLLVGYLRPGWSDGARHAWAILSLLVKRLRQIWPDVHIIFRGDGAFCRPEMLAWCDRKNVGYITGIAGNQRLLKNASELMASAKEGFEKTGEKQRLFSEFQYAAETWKNERKIIVKAEHNSKGENPRFLCTNLQGNPQSLYEEVYCARGDMENRIKDQQLYLFADRTSCTTWNANQFRLLLSGIAYTLIYAIKRIGLKGTKLESARCDSIRLKLLKIGAVIIRNTRRVRFLLASAFPYEDVFRKAAARMSPG